jgi:hypothetical protein
MPAASAARGAARALAGVPGIARPAEHLVEGVAAGREFRAVRFAQDDRARIPEPLHHDGVRVGNVVGVHRRSERGSEAGDRRDVLDAGGQPAEQSGVFTASDPAIQLIGIVQRARI